MLKRLGINFAYNVDDVMFINVDHLSSQVEIMFKGGYTKNIPFSDITAGLTLDMVLDSDILQEELDAEKLGERGL